MIPPYRVPGGYVYTTVDIPDDPACYRPIGHAGAHGEPADDAEDEQRILYGRCGAHPPKLSAGVIRP